MCFALCFVCGIGFLPADKRQVLYNMRKEFPLEYCDKMFELGLSSIVSGSALLLAMGLIASKF